VLSLATGVTGNLKCSIFSNAPATAFPANQIPGQPGAVLGSAAPLANPVVGSNTLTFGTPVSVTQGTVYWIGFVFDTSGAVTNVSNANTPPAYNAALQASVSYASFPTPNPTIGLSSNGLIFTVNITPTTLSNAAFVAEAALDYSATYDYSSTVGQSDLYALGSIGSTPSLTVGVTTRAYAEKSDAGTRNLAVQLQSGATNVQSASTALGTSWNWIARNDLVDPATGAAWTASAVNAAQIGMTVTA
jgi:hypothetical protein